MVEVILESTVNKNNIRSKLKAVLIYLCGAMFLVVGEISYAATVAGMYTNKSESVEFDSSDKTAVINADVFGFKKNDTWKACC